MRLQTQYYYINLKETFSSGLGFETGSQGLRAGAARLVQWLVAQSEARHRLELKTGARILVWARIFLLD